MITMTKLARHTKKSSNLTEEEKVMMVLTMDTYIFMTQNGM